MSLSRSRAGWGRLFSQTGLVLGSTLLLGASWFGIASVLQYDALSRVKSNLLGRGAPQGLTLGKTQISVYRGGKKTASATAQEVDVTWDRSRMTLRRVQNGTMVITDGKPLNFVAPTIYYDLYSRRLSGEDARLNRDKDQVLVPKFFLDERSQILTAEKGARGMLFGGEMRTGHLTWDLGKESLRAKPVVWEGLLAMNTGQGQNQRRRWELRGEDVQASGDLRIYITARATDGEITMQAPRIEHNIKTDVVVATGGVKYWGQEANLAAPKITVFRKEGRSVATGGVTLLLKPEKEKGLKEEEIPPYEPILPDSITAGRPEPAEKKKDDIVRDPKTIRDYPVAVRANEITYWYREGQRRAIITGAPQARQDLPENTWRRLWAHEAYYDGEADLLTLKSRPNEKDARMKASTGDDFKAIEFTISTKEDDDRWSAKKPEGVSYIDDDDDPRAGTGAGSGSGSGAGAGTGGGGTTPPPPPSIRGRIGA